jgi:UDP-N-acetylglucosamine 1-carboxyvinyltransferase
MSNTQHEYKLIGAFIAEQRKERGLTQAELAKRMKTTQSTVARLERGEQNMGLATLMNIGKALNRDILTLASGATNFLIDGGRTLSGTIQVKSSKNAAVGLLCASLLNKGTTTLRHMPRIEEVFRIIEVLQSIGVSAEWVEGNTLRLRPPKTLNLAALDASAANKTRTIIMFMGPLLHLASAFSLPYAGGCKLGTRTVRPHLFGLEKFGARITTKAAGYDVRIGKKKAADVVLYESGDTVTENVLMAAAKMPGISTIKFASPNYMVQDVCFFLEKLGVRIDGIGTTTLTVHGVADIDQDVEYAPSEDPIEAMMFLAIAAVTKSAICIERCPIDFLELELLKLEKMGFKYHRSAIYAAENGRTKLVDITTAPSTLTALKDKIEARPYPGLNIDNLPFFVPIACVAKGRTLIHDWVYENRAIYYTEMNKIGGNVTLADVHRAYVDGPVEFRAADVVCPPALRPAANVFVGMLAAKGRSILRNVYSINRGYEDLAERLNAIGANIQVLRDLA